VRYALLLAFALLAVPLAAADTDKTPTVTISNFAYSPDPVTITQGQSVRFVNQDDVGHTVTDDGGAFDSKIIDKNKSWTYKFDKAGTYKYSCTIHPSMHGTITVSSP
jgi:plastocyanin